MVEFNMENVQKCLCPGCRVNAGSMCLQEKLNRLKEGSGGESKPRRCSRSLLCNRKSNMLGS